MLYRDKLSRGSSTEAAIVWSNNAHFSIFTMIAVSKVFFRPDEIELAQLVFKRILSNDWFTRTDQNEQALAKFLVRCLQNGVQDEERLMLIAETTAKVKWANGTDLLDSTALPN